VAEASRKGKYRRTRGGTEENTSIEKGKTMKHIRLLGLASVLLLSFLGITPGTAAAAKISF
jgi:hypothetical protein